MANPRAFISFDFDHNENEKMLFMGQSRNSRTPFTIDDWSAKEAMPQSQWEAIVEQKIARTNMVIVLVGRYMKTAIGVAKEIKMAARQNVPVFGVYVDEANYLSNLPEGLPNYRVVNWTWAEVARMIDNAMTEGKNRKSLF